MKRSEINTLIREAEAFFGAHQFALPPFANWAPDQWLGMGHEANEILVFDVYRDVVWLMNQCNRSRKCPTQVGEWVEESPHQA